MARRKDRPSGPLDPRSQQILRAVIEEYVTTAEPVGSQTLVERYRLGVSSATVRNVLAELETRRLPDAPAHQRGSRADGHRLPLYVESIAPQMHLAPVERLMIRHQFGQVEFASEQWFRLAAATIAAATHAAGLATPAKPRSCRLRHVDLVATASQTASLVLVLAEGSVKRELVALSEPWEQHDLDDIARLLNAELDGCSARQVDQSARRSSARNPDVPPLMLRVCQRIERMMRDFDAAAVEDVFSDGLLNVMSEPEFSQSEKLRRVFVALQNREYLGSLVRRARQRAGRPGPDRRRERSGGDAGRLARPRHLRAAGPRDGRGRRARSNAHGLPAGDRHRPLRQRPDERTRGAALSMTHPTTKNAR